MSPTPTFALSKAEPSDMQETANLQFKVFTEPIIRDVFMGPDTPAGHSALANTFVKTMHEDASDYWIKVVNQSTGKIVAASNWKIHQSLVKGVVEDGDPEWLKGLDEERLERTRKVLLRVREKRRMMPVPRLHLDICFTDPQYQRRGIGSMMLQWGCDLADQLFLPAWVSGTADGILLYKRFGFEVSDVDTAGGSLMKREARSTVITGGR